MYFAKYFIKQNDPLKIKILTWEEGNRTKNIGFKVKPG